jgi:hypothetical protein
MYSGIPHVTFLNGEQEGRDGVRQAMRALPHIRRRRAHGAPKPPVAEELHALAVARAQSVCLRITHFNQIGRRGEMGRDCHLHSV